MSDPAQPRAPDATPDAAPGGPAARPAAPRSGDRWGGVDALRALSILLVVAYHYFDRWDWRYLGFDAPRGFSFPGWIGVDLFFMISAYCIAATLGRAPTLERFYALRLARIWPAYAAAVALTALAVAVWGLPGRETSAAAAAANVVWLNALAPLIPHVDGVYWSLIVELQFYVLLGLLHFRLRDAQRLVLAWCALTLAGAGLELVSEPLARRALIYPYSAMFLFGLTCFHWPALRPATRAAAAALALLAALGSTRYAGVEAHLLAAAATAAAAFRFRRAISIPSLSLIGLTSYTWYLVHQNIGLIVIRELNGAGLERVSVAAAMAATFLIALALSRLIELRWRAPLADLLERAMTGARLRIVGARAG